MSHHRALERSWLAVGVLALLFAGSVHRCEAVTGCLPKTPNPCAADGVCRPNRLTWGYSRTRWRLWPGESAGQVPDEAGPAVPDEHELRPLPDFEPPPADQEDLRGPAKDTADQPTDEAAAAGDQPAALLPGPEAAPIFEPQGNQIELPHLKMEDAPPALPESLRQAARALESPASNPSHVAARQQSPTSLPPTTLPTVAQPPVAQPAAAPAVRQAGWQSTSSIQLINPASAIVVEPAANQLQQAIYYEASDLTDDESAE